MFLEHSLQSALARLAVISEQQPIYRQFVVGGASVFSDALSLCHSELGYVDRVLLTRILSPNFDECDVFMPDFTSSDKSWRRAEYLQLKEWADFEVPEGVQEAKGIEFEFQMWVR